MAESEESVVELRRIRQAADVNVFKELLEDSRQSFVGHVSHLLPVWGGAKRDSMSDIQAGGEGAGSRSTLSFGNLYPGRHSAQGTTPTAAPLRANRIVPIKRSTAPGTSTPPPSDVESGSSNSGANSHANPLHSTAGNSSGTSRAQTASGDGTELTSVAGPNSSS